MSLRPGLWVCVLALGAAWAAGANAQDDAVRVSPVALRHSVKSAAHAASLRTNATGDPDTVWIGHVMGATGLPGAPGGYGAFHVGRGGNRESDPLNKSGGANNGYWNWDDLNPGEADAWQGWWSIAMPHQSTSTAVRNDWWRCFFGFDYGNVGNEAGDGVKPTFGVTGYWHRDAGVNVGPANVAHRPQFMPLGGTASAWCGLRAHGDLSYTDPVTGGVYNSSIVQYHGDNHFLQTGPAAAVAETSPGSGIFVGGTDMNFPGYGDQWDQLLYRDVFVADGQGLSLSYQYDVNLVPGHATNAVTRVGWFLMDPLLDIPGATSSDGLVPDGNFISSSAFNGVTPDLAPEDSFMVYVGVPVNDAAVTFTDGSTAPVGDPLRRWFSEVLAIDGWTPGGPGVGDQWPNTLIQLVSLGPGSVDGTASFSLTNAQVQPMLDAQPGPGGLMRIVFRVKTNRGWSDEDFGYVHGSSGAKGAAIVDDVVVNGWAAASGDFESALAIDNTVAPTVAWRSTGKPVGDWWELRDLNTLGYVDACGVVGAPNRVCNMFGNVVSAMSGMFATNTMDRQRLLVSPTINLASAGEGQYNETGIDTEIADATGDIAIFCDLYVNLFQFNAAGNGLRMGWQAYPATQPNGVETWGVLRKTLSFSIYDGLIGCFSGVRYGSDIMPAGYSALDWGLMATTNAIGIPDSIRVGIESLSICFRRPAVNAVTCNAAGLPDMQGGYVDNVAIAFIDAAPPPSFSVGMLWADAFPADGNLQTGTDAFRRGAVQVRGRGNIAQGTGDMNQNVIPGDTLIAGAPGVPIRVDLVFRIKPGPGNYQVIGDPSSGIRRDPATPVAATPGDGSFWGSYMADRGIFGSGFVAGNPTPVPNPMPDRFAGGGLDWDPDQWLSARMDTVERNLFDCDGSGPNRSSFSPGSYATMYHESELVPGAPRASLGSVKKRCVLIDVSFNAPADQTNIDCGTGTTPAHLSGVTWGDRWNASLPDNYVTAIGGYVDNSCGSPCAVGTTAEFTKIIPDNQLTPGAHLEWFYRRTFEGNFVAFELRPDTTYRTGDGVDRARWFSMNALPDEWKNPAYNDFGYPSSLGMACMLFVDGENGSGEHPWWNHFAGVSGLTAPWRRGAGFGYHVPAFDWVPGNLDWLESMGGTMVSAHLGQEGSLYDVANMSGGTHLNGGGTSASHLGNRDAAACIGLATGRCATSGPTKTWLRELYQHVYFNAGYMGEQCFGPLPEMTDGDIPMFEDFINNPNGTPSPRTLIISGYDIVAGSTHQTLGHPSFFPTYFDAGLASDSYRELSRNSDDVPDLIPQEPIGGGGAIYGAWGWCELPNDVLTRLGSIAGSAEAMLWEDPNPLDETSYPAAIYAPEDIGANRYARTLVLGLTPGQWGIGSRYTLGILGYHTFWLNALTGMIGTVCGQTLSAPVGVGDQAVSGRPFVSFMNLASENPWRSGTSTIEFGVEREERVEVRVYDVRGRLVRTVADRTFEAGVPQRVVWDGRDDAGKRVAAGVYFYQLRTPSFTGNKKLTVLRD